MNDASPDRTPEHNQLLDLIGDYAAKLRQTCDAYYDRKSRLSLTVVIELVGLVAALYYAAQLFESAFGFLLGQETANVAGIAVLLLGIVVVLAAGLRSQTEIDRSRFDIRPLAAALENLVSRASQLEDHSVTNADERVFFSLRIAEGEAALEYADWVLRSSPFLVGFRTRKTEAPMTRHYRSRSASL